MSLGRDRTPNQHQQKLSFSHPSEREFARILDFYGVPWEYEPRSFLLKSEGDRVLEMFTPDFYLSGLNLYVELTTMRQSLVTRKNRKLRRLKELYPQINIILLYRRDYYRLLAKYGYGPLVQPDVGIDRVLITSGELQQKIEEVGRQISQDYAGSQLVLVGVLKGVLCFMSDLIRQVSLPLSVEFMSISYFGGGGEGVRITKDLDRDIKDCHVLMVEDIVDTGMTLNYLLNYLRTRNPASLRVCALLDKRVRRLVDVPLEYVGFEIPDEFVVGYGLDYLEQYRNLPFIGVLKPVAREEENSAGVDDVKQKSSPK
jgi:hypoxanthine phosphoribosyltransferase